LKTNVYANALLLPSLVFLILFTLYPLVQTVINSLFIIKLGVKQPIFTGIGNFQTLWDDPVFWKIMRNTFLFVLGTVPFSIALALAMAIVVNKAFRGAGFLRTFFFYPTVLPAIAAANIWLFIYTPDYGLLDKLLNALHIAAPNLLGDTHTALVATMVMVIWKESGYLMVFYLAGLQNIPKDMYEAAEVDGGKPMYVFFRITFPLLMPSTLFILILSTTHGFRMVDHLAVMTQGGPNNATNLLLYYIYQVAFKTWNTGMAAALTVVLVVILLFFACVQFFGLDKKIHYN
jgi:sn-glycerol 3-phosphate transport system permease protein